MKKELSEHQISLLNHLYNGGEIEIFTESKSEANIKFRSRSLSITFEDGTQEQLHFDALLDNHHIYLTEKDKIIQSQEQIIAELQEKLVNAKREKLDYKKKFVTDIRKESEVDSTARRRAQAGAKLQYKHLKADEIKEIEALFRINPNTNRKDVANSFETSEQTIARIHKGLHPKNSSEFIMFRKNNPI